MKKVVSVSFKGNHKRYYFEALPFLKLNDKVVVETVRGIELGSITEEEKEIEEDKIIGELKPIIRKATDKDISDFEYNESQKEYLFNTAKEIIVNSHLEMKLLDAEYTLDKSKLIIYFSADERVDFRELVKSLAQSFKTRIELRQVGPRDASRIVGGLGICGRETCCKGFLGEIQNVTIKMAKNQNLALNPNSISGLCGKLLCCISYEEQLYPNKDKNE